MKISRVKIRFNSSKILITLSSLIISALIIFLAIKPEKYISSVYNGLLLFIKSVAPSLFPFFFFTKLLSTLGCIDKLSNLFKKPVAMLYNCPPAGGYIYLMSIISGYPVGSRILSDLYEQGGITHSEAKSMSSFTSTSGPLFIVGTVGVFMFKSSKFGYYALICHYIGALLNGLLYRKKKDTVQRDYRPSKKSLDNILSDCMTSSILSLAIVGGYIAIFSMVIDVLIDIKVIDTLANGLCFPLQYLGCDLQTCRGIVISMIEITRGCQEIALSPLAFKTTLPFVAGMLAFGGMSISFQSLSFLSKCKIKASYYFVTKATQAIITFIIAYVFVLIFL